MKMAAFLNTEEKQSHSRNLIDGTCSVFGLGSDTNADLIRERQERGVIAVRGARKTQVEIWGR